MRQAWLDIARKHLWKVFPVRNVRQLREPADFHRYLCQKLRQAQSRVYLCSLYIGPYADPAQEQEGEFLQALAEIPHGVDVKVLMDKSRAERRIPLPDHKSISSAERCSSILGRERVHLFPLLPLLYQRLLPNPYNEVAGVFHFKLYLIDDQCLISGANLSQEYFKDRHDRYLVIEDHDLVDAYAALTDALCDYTKTVSKKKLEAGIRDAILDEDPGASSQVDWDDKSIQAFAMPTFQSSQYLPLDLPTDVATTEDLIRSTECKTVRLASAYFNPTPELQACWQDKSRYLMTAGPISHGFKPKKKVGNKGKSWIPQVYHHRGKISQPHLWYYNREDWTYHAKGLWLSPNKSDDIRFSQSDDLVLAAHGSQNYNYRSAYRDIESNLLLFFPVHSSLIQPHKDEWNEMCDYASTASEATDDDLDLRVRAALPAIKSFF